MKIRFLFILLGCIFSISASATHIVGGELFYECIDPDNHEYRVTMLLYRDCGGIAAPDILRIGVYDTSGSKIKDLPINQTEMVTIPNATYDSCLFAPPDVCVERYTYSFITTLPPIPGGYLMFIEHCCRNEFVKNVSNPGGNGSSWIINIPDTSVIQCNSSAKYNLFPPTIICFNSPIDFDHSATDPDGDSLVYRLCHPYNFLTTITNSIDMSQPKPQTLPSIKYTPFTSSYSYTNPLGGPTPLTIDPETGWLTGLPWTIGQFVVGVCVDEYRNGELISTNFRDFQYNIAFCDTDITADYSFIIDSCRNTINFINTTDKGYTYAWDFGELSISDDTSSEENPKYIYPDSGTYVIQLIANPGMVCADTVIDSITLKTPAILADFGYEDVCSGSPVDFSDSSQSWSAIDFYEWLFDDGNTSNEENPSHIYDEPGQYNVQLIIQANNGCTDTTLSDFHIVNVFDAQQPDAGPNVTINSGEFVQIIVTDTFIAYNWDQSSSLSCDNCKDPVATPVTTTTYIVETTDTNGCVSYDSITVRVEVPAEIKIPNAFSPNGDQLNDEFLVFDPTGFDGEGLETVSLKIYNRWGELVHEANTVEEIFKIGWDGRNMKNGKELEVGVYVYTFTGTKKNGDQLDLEQGNISLIR